ncbi:MAG: methyltransferase domain-containing protein [Acidobacteria bacterium]|nr:methyltransferase domain-containing protein [Acidobacteriota bacterium]
MKHNDPIQAEERLREEFNRWASAGRGEEMAEEHAAIAAGLLAQMEFALDDKILDLGCGAGWLCGLLTDKVPQGQVVGIDVADEMVRRARERYAERVSLMFIRGEAEDIPWDENFFNKVISIESAYYWPEPGKAFQEIFRVLQPGGTVHILINLYKENVHSHQWREKLAVATHLLSGDEWCGLLTGAGFEQARHARIIDPRPVPDGYQSKWFESAEQMRRFRQEGALLVTGRKPAVPSWR